MKLALSELTADGEVIGMDFSDDGKLLAVSLGAGADNPRLQIFEVAEERVIYTHQPKLHRGCGAAFAGGKLWFSVYNGRDYEVFTRPPRGGKATRIASYPHEGHEGVPPVVRDPAGSRVAICANFVDVRDARAGTSIERIEALHENQQVTAAFSSDGEQVFLWGVVPARTILHDLTIGDDLGAWPTPYHAGEQMTVSGDRWLGQVGQMCYGVSVVDTTTGAPALTDVLSIGRHGAHIGFVGDTMITRHGGITAYEIGTGKELARADVGGGRTTAAASCPGAKRVGFAVARQIVVVDVE